MAKLTISDFTSLANETSFLSALNSAFNDVETAVEKQLSRDGTSPNSMSADLDMDSNDILNANIVNASDVLIGGTSLTVLNLSWESSWSTSTSYNENDIVENDGSTYIATSDHTSGASTEPGTGASWETVWDLVASKGDTGATGDTGSAGSDGTDGTDAGVKYTFNSGTSGDPTSGQFLFNNATLSSVTEINISDTDGDSNDISSWIATWDDSTNTSLRGTLLFRDDSDSAVFAIYNVTGASTDNTSYYTLAVTHVASSGTFAGEVRVQFARTGDKGADGEGSGDVLGPASSTDAGFVLFDGTTGKLLQNGGFTSIDTAQLANDAVTFAKLLNATQACVIGATGAGAFGERVVGIADDNILEVDAAAGAPANGEYARFTANGLEGRTGSEVFSDIKTAATTTATGVVEEATDAEVRTSTDDKYIHAGHLDSAADVVTISDGATISVDWSSFINGEVTLGGNRTLGNPTNGKTGQWRYIAFVQDGTGSRTLSFGANYEFPDGTAPTLTTTASARDVLAIYCRTTSAFEVYVVGLDIN